MSSLVVVLLSLLWLGFFLPSLLQARRTSSPYASATTFQESLQRLSVSTGSSEAPEVIAPAAGVPRRPATRSAAAARRRDILAVLAAACVAGAIIAVGFGGVAVWAALPPVVALATYVTVLRIQVVRRARRRAAAAAERAIWQPATAAPGIAEADTAAATAPVAPPAEVVVIPSVGRRVDPLADVDRIAG